MTISPLDLQVNLSHQAEVAQQHQVEQNRPLDVQQYLAVRMRVEAKREETRIQATFKSEEEKSVDERQNRRRSWRRKGKGMRRKRKEKVFEEIDPERGFLVDVLR